MVSVIFVGAESAGNVGALARVMKNFGFSDLILVSPQCDIASDECKARAKHAYDVVEKARVLPSLEKAIKGFDTVVGTTARLAVHYKETRAVTTPERLSQNLKGSVVIIFGRESSGLTNSEIALCNVLASIPTNPKYGSLNVTHAAAIVLYELSRFEAKGEPASQASLESLYAVFADAAGRSKMKNKDMAGKVFRNVCSRAFIDEAEARILTGALKQKQ